MNPFPSIVGDCPLKEFIDEYKHLEKLCSELYGQQHGISQYMPWSGR